MKRDLVYLVYDKECPICKCFARMVRIKQTVGELVLVNARLESQIMREISTSGLDIDQGVVLKIRDNLFYGADAIHAISLISSNSGFFNRFNYWLFRSKTLSIMFYPFFRLARNILLTFLEKEKINNLGESVNHNQIEEQA